MKIEAKNIQTMEGMDGTAYSANIYVNGKKVGGIREDGRGGSIDLSIDILHCREIEAHMKTVGADTSGYEALEGFLDEIVWTTLDARKLKRLLKKPMAIDPKKPGDLYTFGKANWKDHGEMLKKKNPGFRFLNEMPFAEALAIYSPPVPPFAADGGPGKVK